MEEVKQFGIVRCALEARAKQPVDGAFEKKRVVDSSRAHARLSIPAWTTSTCDGRVHYIVCNEEE